MKIIPVINWVCACVMTSVEDDNFLTEGRGCVNLMIFIWDLFQRFWFDTEKALFRLILGLLLVYADWEKGGACLRVSMCVWFMTYNYWDMFFVVRSNDSFNFPLGLIKYIVIVLLGFEIIGSKHYWWANRETERERETVTYGGWKHVSPLRWESIPACLVYSQTFCFSYLWLPDSLTLTGGGGGEVCTAGKKRTDRLK